MMSGDDMKVLDTLGKSKKAIGGIIAILLCIVAIFFAGMKFADGKENDKITSTTIRNQLTEINELAVYSYDYSKVGKFSNKLSFNGWDIPLTQKNFIVTYDGTIKAGINLDEAKVVEILTFSAATAALTVSKKGAIAALPTTEAVIEMMNR